MGGEAVEHPRAVAAERSACSAGDVQIGCWKKPRKKQRGLPASLSRADGSKVKAKVKVKGARQVGRLALYLSNNHHTLSMPTLASVSTLKCFSRHSRRG